MEIRISSGLRSSSVHTFACLTFSASDGNSLIALLARNKSLCRRMLKNRNARRKLNKNCQESIQNIGVSHKLSRSDHLQSSNLQTGSWVIRPNQVYFLFKNDILPTLASSESNLGGTTICSYNCLLQQKIFQVIPGISKVANISKQKYNINGLQLQTGFIAQDFPATQVYLRKSLQHDSSASISGSSCRKVLTHTNSSSSRANDNAEGMILMPGIWMIPPYLCRSRRTWKLLLAADSSIRITHLHSW